MGAIVGLWEGLYTSIADTLWEFGAGRLLVRTTTAHSSGDTAINVESTDRFPAVGDVAIDGRVYRYGGKTPTTFTGLVERFGPTTLSAVPGLVSDLRDATPVMDDSRSETQLDKLRASFIISRASGSDLDIIGRNFAVPRPRGMLDADYQALLQVMVAIEAGTIFAMEKVLDVLHGVGLYDLYEVLPQSDHTIFVAIPGAATTTERGKAFAAGGEEAVRVTTTTVDVSDDVTVPYGVYAATDYRREGANSALLAFGASAGATSGVQPQRLVDTTNNPFVAGDIGKPVIMTMPSGNVIHYQMLELISSSSVRLGWDREAQTDGRVTAAGTTFTTGTPWFPEWVAQGGTESATIVITSGPNAGTRTITAWVSPYEVTVATPFTATETDIAWQLAPNFGANTISTYSLHRATAVGDTITTPTTMPVDVLVDYTNSRSAQGLVSAAVNGEAQFPFYLWDEGFVTRTVLDLIRPAGTIVVTEIS